MNNFGLILSRVGSLLLYAAVILIAAPLISLAGFSSSAFAQSAEPPNYDDPFYSQKGTYQIIDQHRLAPFQQVKESVDPFTGNMNLLHTDVILPGNGGLGRQAQVRL
jgi:hypothetical protein